MLGRRLHVALEDFGGFLSSVFILGGVIRLDVLPEATRALILVAGFQKLLKESLTNGLLHADALELQIQSFSQIFAHRDVRQLEFGVELLVSVGRWVGRAVEAATGRDVRRVGHHRRQAADIHSEAKELNWDFGSENETRSAAEGHSESIGAQRRETGPQKCGIRS